MERETYTDLFREIKNLSEIEPGHKYLIKNHFLYEYDTYWYEVFRETLVYVKNPYHDNRVVFRSFHERDFERHVSHPETDDQTHYSPPDVTNRIYGWDLNFIPVDIELYNTPKVDEPNHMSAWVPITKKYIIDFTGKIFDLGSLGELITIENSPESILKKNNIITVFNMLHEANFQHAKALGSPAYRLDFQNFLDLKDYIGGKKSKKYKRRINTRKRNSRRNSRRN